MEFKVVLIESDEGFAVSCPIFHGCHSQGATREEALENIRSAIREWLDLDGPDQRVLSVSEETVTV